MTERQRSRLERKSSLILRIILTTLVSTWSFVAQSAVPGFYDNSENAPLLPMIESARSSIDIEIYEMKDPDILDALRKALSRKVKIRVIQEETPVGSSCPVFNPVASKDNAECLNLKKFVRDVQQKGGVYIPFNKDLCGVSGKSCLQHGKMAIIDRASALISTGNFNVTSFCNLDQNPEKCNRDYSVVSTDPNVLETLRSIFEKDLVGEPYRLDLLLKQSKAAQVLTVSPVSLEKIIEFIDSAKKSIQIENQYLSELNLNEALIRAAERGVNVQVTVSSACSFGRPSPSKQKEITRIYSKFDEVGIVSRFFTAKTLVHGKPGYMHAKAIVVDRARAWVGSMNGSNQAATLNREFGIFFNQTKWVQALIRMMESNHNDTAGETWEESLRCENDYFQYM